MTGFCSPTLNQNRVSISFQTKSSNFLSFCWPWNGLEPTIIYHPLYFLLVLVSDPPGYDGRDWLRFRRYCISGRMETRGYDHHTPAGSTGIGHGKCIIQPRRLSRPFLASTYNTSLIQCFILYWKISSLWVKAIPKITFLVRFFFEGKDIRTAL